MDISCFVGLGNPGYLYHNTRHNVGFMILDKLAQVENIVWKKPWWKPFLLSQTNFEKPVLCCKPLTFMNNSGRAVEALLRKYKLKPENFLVIYDDVNLPLGKIRYRSKGSAGGHNGVKSIISYLGTDQFPRLRIGIGSDLDDRIGHVLGKFDPAEMLTINAIVDFVVATLPSFGQNSNLDLGQYLNSWRNPKCKNSGEK